LGLCLVRDAYVAYGQLLFLSLTQMTLEVLDVVDGQLYEFCRHSRIFWSSLLPWAVQNGRQSLFLMNVYFEKHWETDMNELRAELGITPPPSNGLS